MVKIPVRKDPTLEASDRALENQQRRGPSRGLGMSFVGTECERQLWYSFRWSKEPWFDATTLKKFEDGHASEDVMAKRLRLVQGVTLLTLDPETGRQFRVESWGGHLSGYMDGAILGLIQAPRTWHTWEHKASDKGKDLTKAALELGEKDALKQWNEIYWAQAQLYMHHSEMERHYLTCSSPGCRDVVSVRTNYDEAEASVLMLKAERVIFSDRPLVKLSENPTFFKCKWCDFAGICHGEDLPDRNCRTCLSSTTQHDGSWTCDRHKKVLSYDDQRAGCGFHRFIPDFVPGKQTDAAPDGAWIEYEIRSGEVWRDEGC